jgi:hypothetical protein
VNCQLSSVYTGFSGAACACRTDQHSVSTAIFISNRSKVPVMAALQIYLVFVAAGFIALFAAVVYYQI